MDRIVDSSPQMGKEDIADDFCFVCKDGGDLMICDYRDCLKAYHPRCVGKDDSFMSTASHWVCGWHSCSVCQNSQKKLKIQCYCCPTSICIGCIKGSDFVQVKKKDKGFCSHCLKLAKLIEENVGEDSDGEKVDFKDTATYEYLFKDYWEIVKDSEKLTLEDLRAAHRSLNIGEHFSYPSDSEQYSGDNEEYIPSDTFEVVSFIGGIQPDENKRVGVRASFWKQSQKRKNFIGWCSEELISFLKSIGKGTDVPISQMEATEIINRYAQNKNLHHPNKKKKQILCDEKLFSLFRKKTVKPVKISSLLDGHFPGNGSDDDFNFGLEEEDDLLVDRKKHRTNSDRELKSRQSSKLPKDLTSCSASLIKENIKLVYLRRSLVQNLLCNPDLFENKVVGSFVRVKNDAKESFYSPNKIYQLGQVTGIKKTGQPYKMGGTVTDIVLSVTNVWKDVPIFLLSEDDFEEEECEELRQLANSSVFQRLTVAQLQQKANLLHQDITSHWITKEIARLQKQIDLANEKGWRKEHLDHIERREHLLKKEEQERLLREKPEVIPEKEPVVVDKCSKLRIQLQKEEKETAKQKALVKPVYIKQCDKISQVVEIDDGDEDGNNLRKTSVQVDVINLDDDDDHNSVLTSIGTEVDHDSKGCNLVQRVINTAVDEKQNSNYPPASRVDEADVVAGSRANRRSSDLPSAVKLAEISLAGETTNADVPQDVETMSAIWHYVDPSGTVQGPFKLDSLRQWWDLGYFHNNFKVWRHDQTQQEAVFLYDVLKLVQEYQCPT